MSNYKRGIIVIAVISLMILAPLMAIFPLTNAQGTSTSPVGTVTLNPSAGAFPGQIVTYEWSNLPTNLVAPVYVTVYLNGVPYSTGLANYTIGASGGILKGSFIMPNDQPGTQFMVSLSYKDSAQNYGVSSASTSTGAANAYSTPVVPGSTVSTKQSYSLQGIPYYVTANLNFSGSHNVKFNFQGIKGYDAGYLNSTFNASTTQKTTVYPKVNNTLVTSETVNTVYGNLIQIKSQNKTQNVTVNATAYESNKQLQLSLAATSNFNSTFAGTYNATKNIVNITSLQLLGYINQTVEGLPVDFEVIATYTSLINSPGTYTATGQFLALKPSQLAKNFTGSAAVSWDIKGLSAVKTASYTYVNISFTLSVKINGNTPNNLVYLSASYVNGTAINSTYKTTATAKGSYSSYKVDSLSVQSGYTFYGAEVDLQNPGISGTLVNEIVYGSMNSGLIYSSSFANFTRGSLLTLGVPGKEIYFNQTGNTAVSIVLNQTLTGYVNVTLVSSSYSSGIAYISNATWTFSMSLTYKIMNSTSGIYFNGSLSASGVQLVAGNTLITQVASTGTNLPVSTAEKLSGASYLYDKLGYPYLTDLSGTVSYLLNYSAMQETSPITQTFTFTGNVNLTSPSSSPYTVKTSLSGFNTTLTGNVNLYINSTGNYAPVLYGFKNNPTGYANDYLTLKGVVSFNKFVTETFQSNLTYSGAKTFLFNNSYGATWNYALSNGTNVAYSIADVWGTTTGFTTKGFSSFAYSLYNGYVNITGRSSSNSQALELWLQNSEASSSGKITSTVGFGNTSILGYYNTTYTVINSVPALYGLASMSGQATIGLEISIMNQSHALKVDPYFQGMQNVSQITITIYSVQSSDNLAYNQSDTSSNLTIVGVGYSGYLNNLQVTSSFAVTDSAYNLTNYYNLAVVVNKVPFGSTYSNPVVSSTNLTFVKGDVYTSTNDSTTLITADVGSPLLNLTLEPTAKFAVSISFSASDSSGSFSVSGKLTSSTYQLFIPSSNNSKLSFNSIVSGSYNVSIMTVPGTIVLQGTVGQLTYTTSPFQVFNDSSIPISGTVTSEHSSGTIAGWFNVTKYYPVSGNMNSTIWGSGFIKVQAFSANGTQYYATVQLSLTPIQIYEENSYETMITTTNSLWTFAEMSNTGVSASYSYSLLNGTGAMIQGVNSTLVAEIATLTGKYVNMSLSELNAKIVGIYNELNNTYVTVNTNFGVMEAQLKSINATVTSINNGTATIETSLGTIQTSLNTLNAKIIAVNGTVATIKTDIGTLNTSLASINAQLTSIEGNVATIQTSLGTLQGTVTSINGTVATIKTQLGTLQTSVNGVTSSVSAAKSATSNALTFEVLILVLVLITLVIAIGTMLSANRMVKRLEELKKQ